MVCAWMRLFIPEKTIWLERKLEFFFFCECIGKRRKREECIGKRLKREELDRK